MNEYIIINKTAILKRIQELKKYCVEGKCSPAEFATFNHSILELKEILSQSTPLIPEIEKSFDAGHCLSGRSNFRKETKEYKSYIDKQDYISNLKLDV